MYTTSRPAWQTDDLAEEWIEEEVQVETDLYEGRRNSVRGEGKSMRSVGSIRGSTGTITMRKHLVEVNASKSSAPGTFVIREDVQASPILPQTPGKKAVVKDFFSPLALERMFEPPSPPQHDSGSHNVSVPKISVPARNMGPGRPSRLSQVVNHSTIEESDEIVETDVPNLAAFGGHKLSASCEFTFIVPSQSAPKVAGFGYPETHKQESAVSNNFLLPSNSDPNLLFPGSQPQAQSTPIPSQSDTNVLPSTDSSPQLFQFQYDTFTKAHLSAIVNSLEVNSSSAESSFGSPLKLHQESNNVQELNNSFSNLRSAKRIKLTPPPEKQRLKNRIQSRKLFKPKIRKDNVGESKEFMQQIKQQTKDVSLVSAASQNGVTPKHDQRQETTSASSRNLLQISE